MKIERKTVLAIVAICTVVLASGIARADWVPEDGHKMHFPQLPDPNGWDVNITADNMFDDWKCSQSGPVDDIHFWASWKGDVGVAGFDNADPNQFGAIRVQIWSDMPADCPDNPLEYSHPDLKLWEQYFSTTETTAPLPDFTMREAGQGAQGWFDPQFPSTTDPLVIPDDHDLYYQINFTDIPNPFEQVEGTIYWLAIHAMPINVGPELGWKTADVTSYPEPYTDNHFQDDGVFYYGTWLELRNPDINSPSFGESLDLAFVITPEPVTMVVLALGLLPILLMRRHRKMVA